MFDKANEIYAKMKVAKEAKKQKKQQVKEKINEEAKHAEGEVGDADGGVVKDPRAVKKAV